MEYEHACFISYKRPPAWNKHHVWLQFAEAFQQKLDERLDTPVPSYRDSDLQPGADYPAELSRKLCKSMCMVALIVPQYFESNWCNEEWKAMASFEVKRLNGDNRSLIIPVICTGDINTLGLLIGPRQAVDLSGIDQPRRQLENTKRLAKISEIARRISDLSRRVAPPECNGYALPIGREEMSRKVKEPSPFSH